MCETALASCNVTLLALLCRCRWGGVETLPCHYILASDVVGCEYITHGS